LEGYDDATEPACAVVEPTTKSYWLYLDGNIYVLSNYPESKILAWSIFKPTFEFLQTPFSPNYNSGGTMAYVTTSYLGARIWWTPGANDISITDGVTTLTSAGTFISAADSLTITGTPNALITAQVSTLGNTFIPTKMIVMNGSVYIRDRLGYIFKYTGYDHTQATVELPWLDLKTPSQAKQFTGIDLAMTGNWTVQTSANPRASSYTTVVSRGSATSPSMILDSTFDIGHFSVSAHGTHFKIKAQSGYDANAKKLGKISIIYKEAEMK
jgi:hypothetical protein